ncbi:MAG: S-layer homology domain-containing protein, partial [Thermotaleaceae bacterium]
PLFLNNNTIESIEMKLNGRPIIGKYDQNLQAIIYTPKDPLKAGSYKVDIGVTFTGWTKSFTQSWQFKISEDAVTTLPEPTEEQKKVANYVNQYRKLAKLQEFQLNDALNGAALAHANYMALNKQTTHDEFANAKGFTGIKPRERASAFGYEGSLVDENISYGDKDYRDSVDGLMDAPYYRLSWLNPFLTDLGYGEKDKYYTYDLGGRKPGKDTIVVYPVENQKNVRTNWNWSGTPNPLRLHNKKENLGYPITLSYFTTKNIQKFTIEKASLTNSRGNTISIYMNTPDKDQWLQDSIILIPSVPMAEGEKYTVAIKGKIEFEDKTSFVIDKTWNFTTASSIKDINKWIEPSLLSNFGDIKGHWAQADIVDLEKQGIVTAKSAMSFKPDDKITRAEFAEFVVKALGLEIKGYEGSLKDVRITTNKSLYIEAAHRAEIVRGVGNGNFEPNRLITREEMAVMMIRAFGKKGNTELIKDLPTLKFTDKDHVSQWAYQDVRAASKLEIIRGRIGNRFVPKDNATRAEAAVMMKRLLEKL